MYFFQDTTIQVEYRLFLDRLNKLPLQSFDYSQLNGFLFSLTPIEHLFFQEYYQGFLYQREKLKSSHDSRQFYTESWYPYDADNPPDYPEVYYETKMLGQSTLPFSWKNWTKSDAILRYLPANEHLVRFHVPLISPGTIRFMKEEFNKHSVHICLSGCRDLNSCKRRPRCKGPGLRS